MSLNFAAISPHPPIIIPEIGQPADLAKVANTIQAMKKLGTIFNSAEIDTLIIISPHMLTYPDRFNIASMKKLFGTFASFGVPEIMMEFSNNLDLAIAIDKEARAQEIETVLYNNNGEFFELDHGAMVPLFYLNQNQDSTFKVLPMAYANLTRANHFSFGQIIGEVIKKYPGRVGVVASGDLSHRLKFDAPGYDKIGAEFDNRIVEDLKNNRIQEILYYDEDFVVDAGECGYRSILILLGVLDGLGVKPKILSYEGPFGVGYLVASFELGD